MPKDTAKKIFERTLTAHHAGVFQQAKIHCEEALKINPRYADPLHLLAMIAGQEKNIALAITYLTRAIEIAPLNPVLHNHLANFYYKTKNDAAAETHYARAVELQPDYTDAHYNLGLLTLKQEHLDTALVHFKDVLRYAPHHFAAEQKCGDIYMQQEKINEAIACYQTALTLEPYSEEVLNNLGAAYLKNNNPIEAIKCFSTLLRLDEENTIARGNLAATLIQQHRYRDAMWHYKLLLQNEPDNIEGHYNLGVSLLKLGESSEALAHFRKTLTLQPDHMDARNNLGITLLKLGQKEDAAKVFEESLRLQPDNPAVRYLYDALTGKITPEQAPPDYVKELFDTYADYYEEHVTESLHYEVPKGLRALVEKTGVFSGGKNKIGHMLDLGCGTGLSGQAFRDLTIKLTGVDISSRMIDLAQAKGIYNELVTGEMLSLLKDRPQQFDFILAADVLVYVGDLLPLFSACYDALHAGGLFAFSTEISEEADYFLQTSARYAHAKHYIEQVALSLGFRPAGFAKTVLRTQENQPVEGYLVVLGK